MVGEDYPEGKVAYTNNRVNREGRVVLDAYTHSAVEQRV